MKEYARRFYHSAAWHKVSRAYMESKHYVCERCGKPAVICHHKIYISPRNINNPSITLNPDNLEALCQDCHNKEHFGKQCNSIFDKDGNLIGVKESAEIQDYKKALSDMKKAGF